MYIEEKEIKQAVNILKSKLKAERKVFTGWNLRIRDNRLSVVAYHKDGFQSIVL